MWPIQNVVGHLTGKGTRSVKRGHPLTSDETAAGYRRIRRPADRRRWSPAFASRPKCQTEEALAGDIVRRADRQAEITGPLRVDSRNRSAVGSMDPKVYSTFSRPEAIGLPAGYRALVPAAAF